MKIRLPTELLPPYDTLIGQLRFTILCKSGVGSILEFYGQSLLTCHFLQDGVARQNWRQFDEHLIQNYCRKDAYECRIPRQKVPRSFKIAHCGSEQQECDVFSSRTIPPYHILQNWNQQLLPYCELAKGFHYIETSQERYGLKGINNALLLDRARSIKASVEKELDWFAEPFLTPKSVTNSCLQQVLTISNRFYCHIHVD